MTSTAELIGIVETMRNTCISMATGGKFSYEEYEENRAKIMSYPELITLLPDWLIKNRYGSAYWHSFISTKFGTYAERRNFLKGEFDGILNELKNGVNQPISLSLERNLKNINNEIISSDWKKVISRSQNDPSGAITASKSMLESVMKYVLQAEGVVYTRNDDLMDLYKKVKKAISLDPKNHNIDVFKQILTGISTVVNGFSSLRNDYGDAHGKDDQNYIPEQRHAELVINLAGSLSAFIIDTYETKQPNEHD